MNSNDPVHNADFEKTEIRILFVCLGNICRSPSAEGIFDHLAKIHGTKNHYTCDSAGTANYHIGKAPDRRAISALVKQGLNISDLRCRQISLDDFEYFDIIIAMDEKNQSELKQICPDEHRSKIFQMAEYHDECNLTFIPDPFHGTPKDFDDMIELLFESCQSLLKQLEQPTHNSLINLASG